MENYLVRRAVRQDAEPIHKAHMRSIQEVCSNDHSPAEIQAWGHRPYREAQRFAAIESDFVWVVECDGAIEGYGHLKINGDGGGNAAHIHGLYLTPRVIGKALGMAIVTEMKRELYQAGVGSVTLESTITAHGFYRKMGFSDDGPAKTLEINGTPIRCIPMRMDLAVSAGKIQMVTPGDAAELLDIYAPYVLESAVSFEVSVPTLADFQGRIREGLAIAPWLAFALDGRIVGYAYGSKHRSRESYQWSVDVSVYVASEFQKRGIGTHLYRGLLEALREQGYFNAFAGIALPNAGSIRLHESLGFIPVGVYKCVGFKLGKWHDVGWWQKNLRPSISEPKELKAPCDVVRQGIHFVC